MKTRDDLINEALTILGALPAGQEAETEDYAFVAANVEGVMRRLARLDIYFASADALEDDECLLIADILAARCTKKFGVVGQEKADLEADAARAERELKLFNRSTTLNLPVRIAYF